VTCTNVDIVRRVDHQHRSTIRYHRVAVVPILGPPNACPCFVQEEVRCRKGGGSVGDIRDEARDNRRDTADVPVVVELVIREVVLSRAICAEAGTLVAIVFLRCREGEDQVQR
jgi:hypothetical protein